MTAAVCFFRKVKKVQEKKEWQQVFSFFYGPHTLFNSMPSFDPCLLTHLTRYPGSALLFSQFIILFNFKENWKLTPELRSKNIKHSFYSLITNYMLSILYLTPANFYFLKKIYYIHHSPLCFGVTSDKGTYVWAVREAQSLPQKLICCDQSSIAASSLLPHVFTQFCGTLSTAHHN